VDFTTAAVTAAAFVVGGIFQAVVGAAVGEFHARRDESRAASREQRQSIRAARLEALDDTRRMWERKIRVIVARSYGRTDMSDRFFYDDPLLSKGRMSLIGDKLMMVDALEAAAFFLMRPRGVPLSEEDSHRLFSLDRRVVLAIGAQEERVLRGLPALELSPSDYEEVFGLSAQRDRHASAVDEWHRQVADLEHRALTLDVE
jgi:hypothetical protein